MGDTAMRIYINPKTARKLREKHGVEESEVRECFANQIRKSVRDTREEHQTDPPTWWFIAETNNQRPLKIVYVQYSKSECVVKTAYEPNANEKRVYAGAVRR
jgi:uncharacterized DUF497 family protein